MREDDYLPPEDCLAADERPIANRTRCITDYELSYAPCERNEDYGGEICKRMNEHRERE